MNSQNNHNKQINDEFNKVEYPALENLKKLGWTYIEGNKLSPDISEERNSFKQVVLKKRLYEAIKRLNPWIDNENCKKIFRKFTQIFNLDLIEANKEVYKNLTQYISIDQDLGDGRKSYTVKVIDFENINNNEFLITNQFKVAGINQNIVPDIVLFVNGLPLAVITVHTISSNRKNFLMFVRYPFRYVVDIF